MPVANPDGYDYTSTEGNRLWRKNLRDNDSDGDHGVDGVDPNRNFPYRWGYDNEDHPGLWQIATAAARRRDQGARRVDAQDQVQVPDQLPLGRRAAVVRGGLAGRNTNSRRPAVRDACRGRCQARCPWLRPRHLGRPVHHQRRDHRARAQPLWNPRVHPGDVHVRDSERKSTPTTRSTRMS